jgi:predicted DNA-binding transcriptional regulator YafY
MSISSSSSTTASRDIAELVEFKCIKQIDGTAGRNVKYEINI